MALALALALGTPGLASGEDVLEEVLVTARRFNELRETVPLSISVADSDLLGAGAVSDLLSLSAYVPGLYFESMWGGGNSAPVLRGQAQPSTAGDNVGVFVDGIYQGNRASVDVEPLDLERIEVARGPQNGLYGRSTFAGAIHYVSRDAASTATGVALDVGAGRQRGLRAWTGLTMGAGWHARLAGSVSAYDGTTVNAAAPGARLGGSGRRALALALASPADAPWRLTARYRYQRGWQDHPATSGLYASQYNCGSRDATSGLWSYTCERLRAAAQFDVSPDLPPSSGSVQQASVSLQAGGEAMHFESLTSAYDGRSTTLRDFDDTSAGEAFGVCILGSTCSAAPGLHPLIARVERINVVSRNDDEAREFTQEFRLSGTSARLRWLFGVVGIRSSTMARQALGAQRGSLSSAERYTSLLPAAPLEVGPQARVNSALVDDPARQQVTQSESRSHSLTHAFFAAIDYAVRDAWRMRVELRATREQQDLNAVLSGFLPGFGRAIPGQVFRDWNPRLSVEWQASSATRWYVSLAKGSRAGGINPGQGLIPDEQTFRPEYNWTTELGWRRRQATLGLEAMLYYIDWEHTQIAGFSTVTDAAAASRAGPLITRNTAGIVTSGVETSATWRPHPQWTLNVSWSFADPRFRAGSDEPGSGVFCGLSGTVRSSSFCVVGPSRGGGTAAGTWVPWVDGNVPSRTPRHTGQFGIEWRWMASGSGSWRLRVDLSGQGRVYDRSIDGAWFGARMLGDARLDYARGFWSAQLWLRNLGDVRYVRTAASRGPQFYTVVPRPMDVLVSDGRRIGVTLRYAR